MIEDKETVERLVAGLIGAERHIATAFLSIPDTRDAQVDVVGLYMKYGAMVPVVTQRIEFLRTEIGCSYEYPRRQLLQRLNADQKPI